MTEPTPKRRGRPPGSKNKPTTKPPETISPPPKPVLAPIIMESTPLETPGLSVRLRKSRQPAAFGDTARTYNAPEATIEWPAGWPLPTTGQVILSSSISGAVDRVEFDLDGHFISITLK